MNSYRPPDAEYRGAPRRRGVRDDDDEGFQFRGAARRNRSEDYVYQPEQPSSSRYGPSSDDVRYDERDYGRQPPQKRQNRGPRDRDDYYDDPYVIPPPQAKPETYRGEKDASKDNKPTRLVLVLELKESTTEAVFAKGLEKLYRASEEGETTSKGARPASLRRVLIIRDRQTAKSLGFGYAEYHTVEDAIAAVAKAKEMSDKCTISSKRITLVFPHSGVFPPDDFGEREQNPDFLIHMLPSGARHKYYMRQYYATEMMVNQEAPAVSRPNSSGSEGAKKEKQSDFPPVHPKDFQPSTLEAKDADAEREKKRKTKGPAIPAALQLWQNKAAELRVQTAEAAAQKEKTRQQKRSQPPASGVNAIAPTDPPRPSSPVSSGKDAKNAVIASASEDPQPLTYSINTEKLTCCFLCGGQFPTLAPLVRHLRESQKHAQGLQDEAAKAKALQRKKAVGHEAEPMFVLPAEPVTAPEKPQYRDRAAERREEEAEHEKAENVSFSLKGRANAATPSAPAGAPDYSKGLGMLQKAGWTAGEGLGASGEGRAAPIEQNMYAQGVGLGHEASFKGNAVEEARLGFVEKTREAARLRFEAMKK